jgi:hypothetical protein
MSMEKFNRWLRAWAAPVLEREAPTPEQEPMVDPAAEPDPQLVPPPDAPVDDPAPQPLPDQGEGADVPRVEPIEEPGEPEAQVRVHPGSRLRAQPLEYT